MGMGGGVALGTGVWVDVGVGLGSRDAVALGGRVQVGGISNVAEGKGVDLRGCHVEWRERRG